MTLKVTSVTPSTVFVRYFDGETWIEVAVPRSKLELPSRKPGFFEQADIAWGFKKPLPSKGFEELTLAEIQKAALDYVQRTLKKKSS